MTPTTESRGLTDLVIRITPSSVTRSQQRRTGSVQANLFGGTPDDPVAGFCRHVRQLAAELRGQKEEARRVSEGEDDPVEDEGEDEDEDEGDEEDEEDEEEEEDPGYDDLRDDEEDNDSPPASSHKSVIRSTSKKKPVSRPKRKAYWTQSGPRSSFRKRTRGSQR